MDLGNVNIQCIFLPYDMGLMWKIAGTVRITSFDCDLIDGKRHLDLIYVQLIDLGSPFIEDINGSASLCAEAAILQYPHVSCSTC